MKKGILVYTSQNGLVNIGDYIQSLAACQFTGNNIDYYINRERLDEFKEDDVKMIMNGWFTHEPNHWPPSILIQPLFVAFHINSTAKDKLLTEEGIQYFKKHEPIGCRDNDTVELLSKRGIDAYFSGCLTLTLSENYISTIKNRSIFFVDAYASSKKDLFTIIKMAYLLITKFNVIKKLARKQFKVLSIFSLRKTVSFYREYSKHFSEDLLTDAEYITHLIPENIFKSEKEKFDYAQDLLRKYAHAQLIITSRIHCALPCLAIETPVIYVEDGQQDKASYCRLDGLRELFNIATSKDGELTFNFDKGCDLIDQTSILKNKENYKPLRDKLIDKCKSFINS